MKKICVLFAGFLLVSFSAFAQDSADPVNECEIDSDCPAQFVCETVEMPCDATPCMCACEPCPDDAYEGCGCVCPVCDVVECTGGGEYTMCVWEPVKCVADDECADGFECVAEEMCSGGASCVCPECVCDPAAGDSCECPDFVCDCGDVTEPECELGESYCMPEQVPCAIDSDCAEGFTCVSFGADVACLCSDCACPVCESDACMPCECEPCDCGDVSGGETESYCLPESWSAYVDLEDGQLVYEPARDGDAVIAIDDESDSGATTNPTGETDTDADSGDCTAGRTGALSWILLFPFVAILAARRRSAKI